MDLGTRLALLLKESQLEKTSTYLSESCCVALIDLSVQRGALQVIHSIDGKEYVTPTKLRMEIYDRISENEGRITILLLTQLLNVGRSHALKYSKEVCAKSGGTILLVNDMEIITDLYLDRIVQETQDRLHSTGILHHNELTTRFGLPLNFLLNAIKAKADHILIGENWLILFHFDLGNTITF
ncbi:E3 UFM1-protein ligase 1 [Thelohanellus kitauei]|uniref:E3 UFM1-protein ligase 1 n=1 Tax=Thelohanellus kitauei TaxID=669202 RepID=A0A0C2MXX8_THEKT|nr:E3 UFM1-protein ligase 1 [Thelohanellus kitauei]